MLSVPVAAVKRGDDVIVREGEKEVWIRVTGFDDTTITGSYGVRPEPGRRVIKEHLESVTFPRESIIRYGRK
jgi:hypothetical protein